MPLVSELCLPLQRLLPMKCSLVVFSHDSMLGSFARPPTAHHTTILISISHINLVQQPRFRLLSPSRA